MVSPKGTATTTAKAKPQVTRNKEATTYLNSSPCCRRSPMPVTTPHGVGRRWMGFRVMANCQSNSRTAMSAMGRRRTIKVFRPLSFCWPGRMLGCVRAEARTYTALTCNILSFRNRLKNKSRSDGELVVVGVELRGGNLHTCAKGNTEAAFLFAGMHLDFAEDDARSQEVLLFAVVFSTKEVGRVRLQLRPHVLGKMILCRGIPGDGTAQLVGLTRGQIASETGDKN